MSLETSGSVLGLKMGGTFSAVVAGDKLGASGKAGVVASTVLDGPEISEVGGVLPSLCCVSAV